MNLLRRTTNAQRVVLVVALGLLLASGWAWWYFGEVTRPDGGWFAYAPGQETDTYWYTVDERRIEFLVVPIALVLVWTALSLWLLGLGTGADEPQD